MFLLQIVDIVHTLKDEKTGIYFAITTLFLRLYNNMQRFKIDLVKTFALQPLRFILKPYQQY